MQVNTYIVWRIDGEFLVTLLPDSLTLSRNSPLDEWVSAAIEAEYGDLPDDEREAMHKAALDLDYEDFVGYEVVTIFQCLNQHPLFIY